MILHVSPAKAKLSYFSINRHNEMVPLVFMNDIEILRDDESKYLGLHFDMYVSQSSYIGYLCSPRGLPAR